MILIHDAATAVRALASTIDSPMRAVLVAELALLTAGEHDLTEWTDIIVVQPGDTEDAIKREAGFSPMVDPISGVRFRQPGFEPPWDLLTLRGGVFRLVATYGSTFATVLLVPDAEGVLPELLDLCRRHVAA